LNTDQSCGNRSTSCIRPGSSPPGWTCLACKCHTCGLRRCSCRSTSKFAENAIERMVFLLQTVCCFGGHCKLIFRNMDIWEYH
jgi:hypothetical protein